MKIPLALGITASLLGLVLVPGPQAVAGGKKGPVVVATDDPADWGSNIDRTLAPAGTPLGMELVEAAIGLPDDKETINFILKLAGSTAGGVPELVRYGWEFTIDGDAYQLSGGRSELLRGLCNPLITDPACPPDVGDPSTLMDFPFFVRSGICSAGEECVVRAVVNATFDEAEDTITIPVPWDVVGAKRGSTISSMATGFGAVYATPGAMVTNTSMPHDSIMSTKMIKIPKR